MSASPHALVLLSVWHHLNCFMDAFHADVASRKISELSSYKQNCPRGTCRDTLGVILVIVSLSVCVTPGATHARAAAVAGSGGGAIPASCISITD